MSSFSSFQKTAYFKHSKKQWGANDGEVATWCILFVFGLVGIIQLVANSVMLAYKKFGFYKEEKGLIARYRKKSKADAGEAVEMEESASNVGSPSTLPIRGNEGSGNGGEGGKENEEVGTPRARVAPVENETSYTDFKPEINV